MKELTAKLLQKAEGVSAQGRGEAAIVAHDEAPVYKKSKGEQVEARLTKGDAVAGITPGTSIGTTWEFEERDGRVRGIYFPGNTRLNRDAWMDPAHLSRFYYDLTCSDMGPMSMKMKLVTARTRWNACFKEARDAKLDELRARWAEEDAAKNLAQPREENPKHEPE